MLGVGGGGGGVKVRVVCWCSVFAWVPHEREDYAGNVTYLCQKQNVICCLAVRVAELKVCMTVSFLADPINFGQNKLRYNQAKPVTTERLLSREIMNKWDSHLSPLQRNNNF